jgi:hypothetical protein
MSKTIDVIKSSFTKDEILLAIKEELVYLKSSMGKIFSDIEQLSEFIVSSEQNLGRFYTEYKHNLEPLFIQAKNISQQQNDSSLLDNIKIVISGKEFAASYFNPVTVSNLFVTNVDMGELKQNYDSIIIDCNPDTGKFKVGNKIIAIIQLAYNNRFDVILRRFTDMFSEYQNKDLTQEENQMLYLTYQYNIMIDLLNILRGRKDFLESCKLYELRQLAISSQMLGINFTKILASKLEQALQEHISVNS